MGRMAEKTMTFYNNKKGTDMFNTMKRLVIEEDGMEMIEWAIVGVVFAVAAAVSWGQLADSVDSALNLVERTVKAPPGGKQ